MSGGYIFIAFQQGRPPICHEGRKMVQWWYLHFLLPQRSLPSSRELTESRTHSGRRGHCQDLIFLARLESHFMFYLGCFLGEPCSLLPSLKRGGRSGGPQGDSRLTDFYLWESHVFAALEPGLTDCPPFFCQILE